MRDTPDRQPTTTEPAPAELNLPGLSERKGCARLAVQLGLLIIALALISLSFVLGWFDEPTTLALAGLCAILLIIVVVSSSWRQDGNDQSHHPAPKN